MLHVFISVNHDELLHRCRAKVAKRFAPAPTPEPAVRGVPLFLTQLADTLRRESTTLLRESSETQPAPAATEIGRSAALYGAELMRLGYTADQVVHDYGDVCQAITELAVEKELPIVTDEFRTLNRCLDNAIADAVTAFGAGTKAVLNTRAATQKRIMGSFADEHLRLIDIAIHAYSAIKTGNIGFNGATGALLDHVLGELRALSERMLPEPSPKDEDKSKS